MIDAALHVRAHFGKQRLRRRDDRRGSNAPDAPVENPPSDRMDARWIAVDELRPELGERLARPLDAVLVVAERLLREAAAVGAHGQRDDGVRVRVVDVRRADEGMEERLDRRPGLVGHERAAAEVGDHRRVVHRLAVAQRLTAGMNAAILQQAIMSLHAIRERLEDDARGISGPDPAIGEGIGDAVHAG